MIEGLTLLDTNVLVYAANSAVPQHKSCSRVLSLAMAGGFDAVLMPQVLTETLATLTGSQVKKPIDLGLVADYLDFLVDRLLVLPVTLDSVVRLSALARTSKVCGQAIYDLFLVAQMESHGIARVCTHDQDFSGLAVESLTPEQLLSHLS